MGKQFSSTVCQEPSIYELKDHLISCYDCDFLTTQVFERRISLIEDAKMVLNGYINYVISQKRIEEDQND